MKFPKPPKRTRDVPYMLWVKTLKCRCSDEGDCQGVIVAHHAGTRGMGRKADDNTTVPLCDYHHKCWHAANGVFKEMDRDFRRQWAETQIMIVQKMHEFKAD